MPSIGSFAVAKKVISGAVADKVEPTTFDFEGHTFTVIDYVPSALPLMELADAIQSGVDADSMPALAAMYQMLQHCIAEADWPRFRALAMKSRATTDDVMPIVAAVYEAVTGNPTDGPSASPPGPTATSNSSKVDSPSPATDHPSPSNMDGEWWQKPGQTWGDTDLVPVDQALSAA